MVVALEDVDVVHLAECYGIVTAILADGELYALNSAFLAFAVILAAVVVGTCNQCLLRTECRY